MTSYMLRMSRREDRRLATGRCTVTRGTTPNHADVYTDLPCRVRPSDRAVTEVEVGGEQVSLGMYDVKVDVDVDIRRGDVVTVTRSADALLEGAWLTVVEVVVDEWVATRIAVCQRSRGNG